MDLKSELQRQSATALKKVETVDHSAPYLKDSQATVDKRLDEYIASVRAVDCEAFYDQLRDYTYQSEFVPISIDEAHVMLAAYRAHCRPHSGACALSSEQEGVLAALRERVADQMEKAGFAESGAFVKLSSRSPKDATSVGTRCEALFKEFVGVVYVRPCVYVRP
jgi:hypothetical protein